MAGVTLLQGPSWELVPASGLRHYARCTYEPDFPLLEQCARAAIEQCESYTGLAFGESTFAEYFDGWPEQLSKCPVQAVSGVQYLDTEGAWRDAEGVDNDLLARPARLRFSSRPSLAPELNNVRVVYTAGFPSGQLPERAALAIMRAAADLFINRGGDEELSFACKALLAPMRVTL